MIVMTVNVVGVECAPRMIAFACVGNMNDNMLG